MFETAIKTLKLKRAWKINVAGVDISFMTGTWVYKNRNKVSYYTTPIGWHGDKVRLLWNTFYSFGCITHRLVVLGLKVEMKYIASDAKLSYA